MPLHRKKSLSSFLTWLHDAGGGGWRESPLNYRGDGVSKSEFITHTSSQQPGGRGINFRLAPNFMIAAKQQHTVWKYLGISAPLSVDYARPWVLVRPWRSNSEQLKITSIKRSLVLVSITIRSEDMSLNADQVVTY